MTQRMKEGDGRFAEMKQGIADLGEGQDEMKGELADVRVDLGEVKKQVAIYGAIGGLAGSGVVGLILAIGNGGL